MVKVNCTKCNGTGKLLEYSRIQGGTCFRCEGRGYFLLSEKEAAKRAALKEKLEKDYQKQLKDEKEVFEAQKKSSDIKELNKQRYLKRLQSESKHYGEIGQEIELTLSLKKIVKTKYNNMAVLTDNKGHEFIFYATLIPEVLNDNEYHIKGTVKKHSVYNGFKKTTLEGVKVLNEIDWSTLSDDEIDNLYNTGAVNK